MKAKHFQSKRLELVFMNVVRNVQYISQCQTQFRSVLLYFLGSHLFKLFICQPGGMFRKKLCTHWLHVQYSVHVHVHRPANTFNTLIIFPSS